MNSSVWDLPSFSCEQDKGKLVTKPDRLADTSIEIIRGSGIGVRIDL